MRLRSVLRACFFAFLFLTVISTARGQNAAPAPRIAGPVDETNRITLRGNTHPLARPQSDQGAVPDSQPIHRMLLLLQRSPAQETTLRSLLDQQQSRSSSNYKQWLTPQQFGQQFGPADADVQTVTSWLASHGFEVAHVSAGKTVIEFSGNAGQVRSAFQTEIHRYLVNGKEHFANSTDPSIPAALAPVVAGPVTLHNFPKHPENKVAGVFQKSKSTGKVTAAKAASGSSTNPLYTFPSNYCPLADTCYALGPADFDTIYNVPSTVSSVAAGTGQTIALVGDSEICTANTPSADTGDANSFIGPNGLTDVCNPTTTAGDDVAQFRSLFGLPAITPACPAPGTSVGPVCIILAGADPGFTSDETEGDLDTQWAATVAPNATEYFVIAADTEATAGIDQDAEYIVDNDLAPVVSESFGECEPFLGNADNLFYYYLWEEAAAQGQTVIIASGDSGSASCDSFDLDYFGVGAEYGVNVNGIGSTPFNVAAGGTDFDVFATGYPSNYWNPAIDNNGVTGKSVKSYAPEMAWNDSCALVGTSVAGPPNFSGSTTTCSISSSSQSELLNIAAGGGGESNCALNNGEACTGSYAKPAWQSGPYVTESWPNTDGVRDIPDISFHAADGFISGTFYIVCQQDTDPSDNACSLTNNDFFDFVGVGGTSSAAPVMAGTMALVNQEMTTLHGGNPAIPTRQGNANYVLYSLANSQHTLSCSSAGPPNASCIFNDVTLGNNSVPCVFGTPPAGYLGTCSSASSSLYGTLESGGVIAWNAGAGYDLATGLGTINVGNLISNWSSSAGVGNFIGTTTSLQMCGPTACTPTNATTVSMTHGSTADLKITVTPASSSIPTPTSANPENAALIMTTSTCTPNNGSADLFTNVADDYTYDVTNANVFSLASGGTVSGSTSYMPGGMYYAKAHYTGDGTFGSSDSNCVSVDITAENSTTALSAPVLALDLSTLQLNETEVLTAPTGGTVEYGDAVILRADVRGTSSSQENASGTVTFKSGSTTLGTVAVNAEGYAELQTGANPDGYSTTQLPIGSSQSITAVYNGGASYATSTSAAMSLTVNQALTTAAFTTASPIVIQPGTPISIGVFVDTYGTNGNPTGGSFGKAPSGTVTFKTEAAAPPAPRSIPRPNVWLLVGVVAALGLLLQIANGASPRRRLGTAVAAVLLAIVATAVIGCGSSGGSSGSSGGGGTTLGSPTVVGTTDEFGFAAGTATLNFTPTASETITATYGGDGNYKSSSTATTIVVTVQ